MRRHAKASSAGSNQRQATGLGRFFRGANATRGSSPDATGTRTSSARRVVLPVGAFAAILAVLVVVGSASAAKTHIFKEAFGPSEQPTFTTPRGMAIDQGSGEVYVIDAGSPPAVKRYNADGTASDFSALSSNVIDGAGGADTTPQGSLAFGAANRVQIALDESGTATDGDLYVAQQASKLVDVFSSTGEYKGQLTESSVGLLGEICGVAVDSAGKLYLGDIAGKIHVYTPAANPPVNGDSTANFATVAAPCQIAAGTGTTAGFIFVNRSNGVLMKVDSATGASKYQVGGTAHRTVYVNPGTGHVYAPRSTGGSSEVVEYDASGAGSATTVSSFKPGSTIEGVAVRESNANVYLTRSGQAEAQVYGPTVTQPDVTPTAVSNNTGTRATLNGSVNPDGVELSECFFEWGVGTAFDQTAPCAETPAEIGSGKSPVAVHADITNLQPNGTQYRFRLVAVNPESEATGSNVTFTTPDTVVTEAASGVSNSEATLNGTVDPDGLLTECEFEWGLTNEYGETVPCAESAAEIGTGTSPVPVHADISGLHPGTVYHFRLVATNPNGPIFAKDKTLQTLGPVVSKTWVEDVIYKEAKLKAEIDPEGAETTYHFEYGTTEAYGSETPESIAGSDSSVHEVTAAIAGLAPGTDYHFRVIATSADGVNVGPDRVLTTYEPLVPDTDCPNQAFRDGPAASLPHCRGYEMVSAPEKEGSLVRLRHNDVGSNIIGIHTPKAAEDGEALAYMTYNTFEEAQPEGNGPWNDTVARRGPDGWSQRGVSPQFDTSFSGFVDRVGLVGYTPDLDGVVSNGPVIVADSIVPESSRNSANLIYGDTRPGGVWRQVSLNLPADLLFSTGLGEPTISADGNHVVFKSKTYGLTGEGPGAFDWNAETGELTKLPTDDIELIGEPDNATHIVSEDGSRIFGHKAVVIDGSTEQSVGLAGGRFSYASADGSVAFYKTSAGTDDLYRYDVEADELVRITEGADVVRVRRGAEDGSRLYFIGEGAIAPGAEAGQRNLYLWSEDGTPDGAITLVATGQYVEFSGVKAIDTVADEVRISRDGRYIVFAEKLRSLTGYANEGKPEFYVYDAVEGELQCVSCIPSGEPASEGVTWPRPDWPASYARYVSDDGRVFFDTEDALLPWDTNGRLDAYEYDSESGELSLLSSGTSAEDSYFSDASADGRDVFIGTAQQLAEIDRDTIHDVYDAREGGGIAAQNPGNPPAPCLGDACQNIPAPPELPTPASANFRGAGNPVPRRNCGAQARRAAKLSRRAKRRSAQLRRRSARLAKNAKRLSTGAKRCRRANRRAGK